jgi:hypothetical protein
MTDESMEWNEATEKVLGRKDLDKISDLGEDDNDDDDTPLDQLFRVQPKKNKR